MTFPADVRERAADIHRRAIVINGLTGGKIAQPNARGAWFELPEIMNVGGVTAANLTVAVSDSFGVTAAKLSRLLEAASARPDDVAIVSGVADIHAAKAAGRPALILGFQDTDPLEGSLENLDLFVRLGIRIVQLTYQRRNLVTDGCGEPQPAGLSVFGRTLVEELNRLGVLIDLSHTGIPGTLETIELSTVPVSFTHACASSLFPLGRNKTDEEIIALARRGGVMGVNAVARLLTPTGRESGARLGDFIDQIDYLVELVGIDHVGLGLDISEGMTEADFLVRRTTFLARYPELSAGGEFAFEHYYTDGLSTMANMQLITEGLVARGYADDDVLKILGGNFVRLFEAVWPTR